MKGIDYDTLIESYLEKKGIHHRDFDLTEDFQAYLQEVQAVCSDDLDNIDKAIDNMFDNLELPPVPTEVENKRFARTIFVEHLKSNKPLCAFLLLDNFSEEIEDGDTIRVSAGAFKKALEKAEELKLTPTDVEFIEYELHTLEEISFSDSDTAGEYSLAEE